MTDWDLTTRGARRVAAPVKTVRSFYAPKHSHDSRSSMTHALNVARRNGTPYQPRHCGCRSCVYGFTHVAQVVL